MPLTFTKDAALDFYIRCSDGSAYEAKGLKLARAQANGTKIEFTLVRVSLSVNGTLKNTAAFKKVVSENVAGVKLNKTSLSLKTGSSATLTATVSPRGGKQECDMDIQQYLRCDRKQHRKGDWHKCWNGHDYCNDSGGGIYCLLSGYRYRKTNCCHD